MQWPFPSSQTHYMGGILCRWIWYPGRCLFAQFPSDMNETVECNNNIKYNKCAADGDDFGSCTRTRPNRMKHIYIRKCKTGGKWPNTNIQCKNRRNLDMKSKKRKLWYRRQEEKRWIYKCTNAAHSSTHTPSVDTTIFNHLFLMFIFSVYFSNQFSKTNEKPVKCNNFSRWNAKFSQ